jgi:very-short-patch-repair endonuclease
MLSRRCEVTSHGEEARHEACAVGGRPLPSGQMETLVQSSQPHAQTLTLKQRARVMRHNPTPSEHLLWQHLKGRKLAVQFRRQVVIGNFIVDFLASEAKLIVEVDGGYHAQRVRLDAARQRKLERLGYRVLRINEVLVLARPHVAASLVSLSL